MIEHAYTVLCRESLIDRDSNQAAIFPLEEVTLEGAPPLDFPIIDPWVYSLWCRESDEPTGEKVDVRIRVIAPSNEVITEKLIKIPFDSGLFRIRARVRLRALPYKGVGIYIYSVEQRNTESEDWHQAAKVPLRVILKTPPQ